MIAAGVILAALLMAYACVSVASDADDQEEKYWKEKNDEINHE